MKCFDYDLEEFISLFYVLNNSNSAISSDIKIGNRLINKKLAFYERFKNISPDLREGSNYIHEAILELTVLKVMMTLYSLIDLYVGTSSDRSSIRLRSIAHAQWFGVFSSKLR